MFTEGFIKGVKIFGIAAVASFGGLLLNNQVVLHREITNLQLTPTVVSAPTSVPTASPSATIAPTVIRKYAPVQIAPVVSKAVVK